MTSRGACTKSSDLRSTGATGSGIRVTQSMPSDLLEVRLPQGIPCVQSAMATALKLAVCLFDEVTSLDFQGPIEQFNFISPKALARRILPTEPQYVIDTSYLAVSLNPVQGSGPALVPTRTYDSVTPGEQFDIIMVPGGVSSYFHDRHVSLIAMCREWHSTWCHSGCRH